MKRYERPHGCHRALASRPIAIYSPLTPLALLPFSQRHVSSSRGPSTPVRPPSYRRAPARAQRPPPLPPLPPPPPPRTASERIRPPPPPPPGPPPRPAQAQCGAGRGDATGLSPGRAATGGAVLSARTAEGQRQAATGKDIFMLQAKSCQCAAAGGHP